MILGFLAIIFKVRSWSKVDLEQRKVEKNTENSNQLSFGSVVKSDVDDCPKSSIFRGVLYFETSQFNMIMS